MRINVIGTTGSGKSTLSKRLAKELNIAHIELDALFWRENWTHVTQDELCANLEKIIDSSDSWVIDGNYKNTEPVKWKKRTVNSKKELSACCDDSTATYSKTGVVGLACEEGVRSRKVNGEARRKADEESDTKIPAADRGDDNYEEGKDEDEGEEIYVVWVDLGFLTTLWQAIKRATSRVWNRTELWDSRNIETFQQVFMSKESILWFTIKTYYKNKTRNLDLFEKKARGAEEYRHINFVRLQSHSEIDAFVTRMVSKQNCERRKANIL